jgi:hypothetical protein
MGWFNDRLSNLDRRNQAVADFLLDHPEAGTQIDPYAKSPQARRIVAVSAVGIVLIMLFFGWIVGTIVLVPLTVALWRLDHHPWLHGYQRTSGDQPGTD